MKTEIRLRDGPLVAADVRAKTQTIALHKAPDGRPGIILTHVATGALLLRARNQRWAAAARRWLERLDWRDPMALQRRVETIRARFGHFGQKRSPKMVKAKLPPRPTS